LNIANALAAGSSLVTYGAMSRQPLKIPNSLLIFKNIDFCGFWLRRWKENATAAELQSIYQALANFLARGVLHAPIHAVFPLFDVQKAVEIAAQENRSGKVILQCS
jgi:hypothetical protein